MCQVTPFTLPCCRQTYVEARRLPSCPPDWPNTKCPRELCVQISGFEGKDVLHHSTGICWRCDADRQGKVPGTGAAREEMRPLLDRAAVAEGLEEFGPDERRRKMEKEGRCWHCGAREGCVSCGTTKGEAELTGFKCDRFVGGVDKGKKRAAEADMGQAANKRLESELSGSLMGHLAILANPYVPQPLDLQLQQHNDYNAPGIGYGQPGPQTFTYQSQEMQSQTAEPHNAFGNWQDLQDYQLAVFGEGNGGVQGPIDSLLEQVQGAEQRQQSIGLAIHQDGGFPSIPDSGADAADTTSNDFNLDDMAGQSFTSLLDGYDNVDLSQTKDGGQKPENQAAQASHGDDSAASNDFTLDDMAGESFASLLDGFDDPGLFKFEDGGQKAEDQVLEASKGDGSGASALASMLPSMLPPTLPATQLPTQAPGNPYADQFAVPTRYPNIGWLPF